MYYVFMTLMTNSEDVMFNNELQQKPDPIDPSNSIILLASSQLPATGAVQL